jgi:mannose-6-phosphate isomerase-like protein (cupin superfamily)
MASTTTTKRPATKFTMRGLQLLSGGQVTEKLIQGEHLWLHSKVYSKGGENALHSHEAEDHAFFVLQGAVEFSFGDGSTDRAERFEGVMIPKGTSYKFEAQGSENLVMLRMGGYAESPYPTERGSSDIRDGAGNPITDNKSAAKGKTPSEPVVPIPGKFFAP